MNLRPLFEVPVRIIGQLAFDIYQLPLKKNGLWSLALGF